MSIYTNLRSPVPDYHVDAGWSRERHTYFVQAFDVAPANGDRPELIFSAGYDAPFELPTIYDLLNVSWTLVDWTAELSALQHLRDDPLVEERVFLENEAMARSKTEPRDKLRSIMSTLFDPWQANSGAPGGIAAAPAKGTVPITSGRRRRPT